MNVRNHSHRTFGTSARQKLGLSVSIVKIRDTAGFLL